MTNETQDFHAEYKVIGGKLVVADVETDGQVITDLKISGDFFLEPEDAYFDLAPALIGASVTADNTQLRDRLDAALAKYGSELAMHGFSTADVATVVRRALGSAADFTDFDWQIIRGEVLPTQVNVALDQVLLEEVSAGRRAPTLRFWEWDDTATVIGAFQSYVNEIRPEGVEKYGVEVVRRISGGGAMFMEGGNCITYSMFVPPSLVAGLDYQESYVFLDQWVLAALKSLGVEAFYKPINDISSTQGKIGGAAQKRLRDGTLLHHATMSYDIDADKMVEILRIGQAKISDKGVASAKKRVDPLRSQTGESRADIIETMATTFIDRYGASPDTYTDAELDRARELVAEKFGTEAWTHRVP
ncbi:biotin/lipoate A/B protein ligase family protein [Brevibacterium ammoniilyticum]|uniref:Biotin/lipoate A/B protein ligase family protein n=1 Tax=Brevibacterium ammoniilyticum TaxID=1046555 RepID=A0ABP9TZD1_9MICO